MKVVSINTERQLREADREVAQHEAFARYVALQDRAKASLRWEDAVAAGRAWADFIALFVRGA